jgi:HEAT repeat protein
MRIALVLVMTVTTAAAAPKDKDTFTVEGRAVTATLVAASTKVIVGEPIMLEVRVANGTADAMYIVSSPDGNGAPDGWKVTVTGAGGPLAPIPPGPAAGNGATGASSLDARGTHVSRLLLSEWVNVDKPGTYTIQVAKTVRLGVGRGNGWDTTSTKHPLQLAVVVEVAAGTPAQLGAVIDRLGAKMLAADEETGGSIAWALGTIHDPRVVPYFVKALALADWNRQFPAIEALGAYATPESLAALQKALAIPGNGRLAAAQSIAAHKSAAGMAILWPLRTDKDPSMRLEVVHALAKLNPPDVVAKLTEMSRDTSAMVSGEAKRYLAERKKP